MGLGDPVAVAVCLPQAWEMRVAIALAPLAPTPALVLVPMGALVGVLEQMAVMGALAAVVVMALEIEPRTVRHGVAMGALAAAAAMPMALSVLKEAPPLLAMGEMGALAVGADMVPMGLGGAGGMAAAAAAPTSIAP